MTSWRHRPRPYTNKKLFSSKASLGQSRYVTYLTTNPTLTRPKIYSKYVPTVKLHKTTQLRLVSHNLQIELGRHRRPVVLREERLCTCGAVETECHFLFECMQYYHIRCKYNLNINELSEVLDDTFTCDYVNELFNCRETFLWGRKMVKKNMDRWEEEKKK